MELFIALVFGLLAWGILGYCIIKRNQVNKTKIAKIQVISWALCTFALYCPYITLQSEYSSGDYSGIFDTVSTFHLCTSVLLGVNLILSLTLFVLSRKMKKEEINRD